MFYLKCSICVPLAEYAAYHVPVCGGAVCAATERAARALVALLVARVAHRVVRVPAGRRARARRPGPAVRAYAAALRTYQGGVKGRSKQYMEEGYTG